MLSLLDILLLVLCARPTLGGPVRKFTNATSFDPPSPSTDLASLQVHAAGKTISHASSLTTLATSSSSHVPAQRMRKQSSASSSYPCRSMELSSSATMSTLLASTTDKQLAKSTLSPTYGADRASTLMASSALHASTVTGANGTTLGLVIPYGGHHAASGYASSSTTTLTLYTTVPPHVQASHSGSAQVSSTGNSYGASSYGFSLHGGSSYKASSYGAETGGRGISETSNSGSAHTTSSSVGTKSTEYNKSTSKPVVSGSLTLTYQATTRTQTGVITLVPSTTLHTQKTRHRKPSKPTATHTRSSSAFAYPLPSPSKQVSSSSATVDPVKTSSTAPSVTYSYKPTDNSSSGLPTLVTQQTPSSTPATVVPSASSSTSIAGITIVPVNPDATTIYITVTTTDAGMTTTIAEQTVTSYA